MLRLARSLRISSRPSCFIPAISLKRQMSSQPTPSANNIVWIDCEMTGLNIEANNDKIMEIACLITDEQLNIVAEMQDSLVIHIDDKELDNMNDWCKQHHGDSGLTERCRQSTLTLAECEQQVLAFVRQHCVPGKSPLAGNSVYVDRRFLRHYMPQFDGFLHYRIIDVSSIKELVRRWYGGDRAMMAKTEVHRALDDIKESIAELKHYRQHFFKDPKDVQL